MSGGRGAGNLPPYILPGDLYPGASALRGNKALTKAWLNGNAFDATRVSDTATATIKFINGQPDVATLNAFSGGINCRMTKRYDQSGNGNDAAQPTLLSAPLIRILGSDVHTVFDGKFVETGNTQSLVLPSTVWNPAAVSGFVVGFQQSVYDVGCPLELGTDQSNFTGAYNNGIAHFGVANSNSGAIRSLWDSGSTVWWFVNSSGSGFGGIGEQSIDPGAGNATVGNPVGGTIGNSVFNAPWSGYIDADLIWPQAMTYNQASLIRRSLALLFGIYPLPKDRLVLIDGDSWSYGRCSGINNTIDGQNHGFDRQALSLLKKPVRLVQWSEPGRRLTGTNSGMAFDYAANIAPFFSRPGDILIVMGGGNDGPGPTEANGTAAQANAALQSYCTSAKATGWTVGVCTPLPFWPPDYEPYRQELISLIKSGFQSGALKCDGILDMGGDQIMGNPAVINDPSKYAPDREHPIDPGYALLAPYISNFVNPLL